MNEEKRDLYYLVELLENFTGQNWRAFTSFAEEETGTELEEEKVDKLFQALKKMLDS